MFGLKQQTNNKIVNRLIINFYCNLLSRMVKSRSIKHNSFLRETSSNVRMFAIYSVFQIFQRPLLAVALAEAKTEQLKSQNFENVTFTARKE